MTTELLTIHNYYVSRALREYQAGVFDLSLWQRARRLTNDENQVDEIYIELRAGQLETFDFLFPAGYEAANDEYTIWDKKIGKGGMVVADLVSGAIGFVVINLLFYFFW